MTFRVVCGSATITTPELQQETIHEIDGEQPKLQFPQFSSKSTDCAISHYELHSEEGSVSEAFDQVYAVSPEAPPEGTVTFGLDGVLTLKK